MASLPRRPRGTAANPYELPDEPDGSADAPFDLSDGSGRYDLVILNDDTHTYEYVMALLHDLFGISWDWGFAMTETIDWRGWRVVFTGTWSEVARKRDAVLAYGPDPRLPTSTGPLQVEIRESS